MTDPVSTSSSSLPLPPLVSSSLAVIKDPRYQRGKVYEIVVLHEDYKDDSYVGSTICPKLSTRFGQHKFHSEQDEPTKKLHILMKTIGMRFFKIVLIEEWPCDSKEELSKREQYHMNLRKPTLNMRKAQTTQDEVKAKQKDYYEENKIAIIAKQKDYYEENKVAILAQHKSHYEENKVAILAQQKIYKEENKVAILAQRKDHYEENKVAILAQQKEYEQNNKVKRNASRRARRAKVKLSYKDLVFLAFREALALRREKQRTDPHL